MKTLDEHNTDVAASRERLRTNKSGVACPKCAAEMLLRSPGTMLCIGGGGQWVVCPSCGHTGVKR